MQLMDVSRYSCLQDLQFAHSAGSRFAVIAIIRGSLA